MVLNKKSALYLMLINGLYILYYIFLLVYLKEPLILDFNKKPIELSIYAWLTNQIILLFCYITIIAGMIQVLKISREAAFIIVSVFLYLLMRLSFDVSATLVAFKLIKAYSFYPVLFPIIAYCVFLYFLISVFFIRNRLIKPYYVWFAIVILVSVLLTPLTVILYTDFDLTWVLVNPKMLKVVPFFVSFCLYFKLYKIADK